MGSSYNSTKMRDRIEQERENNERCNHKSVLPSVPLKRKKQEIPHSLDLLQVLTASRYGTPNRRLQACRQSLCHRGMGVPVAQ